MELPHDPLNIIVSGVGGQGNILASDIISRAFCEQGCIVSVGETYGATQRGGSVSSHIRISNNHPYGPLIPLAQGHIIIGFEPLEVYRILAEYGHRGVRVVMNDRPFYPLDALRKRRSYPPVQSLIKAIADRADQFRVVEATELAKEAGNPQTHNVVMVGAFAGLPWTSLGKERCLSPLAEVFSGEKLAVNRRAFELGYNAVSGKE